ncbi:hypothetical protein [Fimbriiglobus ruber]|uniref:UbiA prenyltransferase n=1 Tax=Fimbriiglobus ruber TaxID=1908690 RepID=A0A225DZK2_9BACT|nr:hypothetical protein [Fimbriiglobus ruber]OWK46781.1 hypothetical protein FRUB_00480 [Fimbriiglobus ruber]
MTTLPQQPGDPARDRRPPWWLWPNVFSLDAPVVAVVWQRFLGAAYGVVVPPAASVVLALVVWAVYLTDRFLDAAPDRPAEVGDRHQYARKFRTHFGVAAVVVWVAAAVTAGSALSAVYLADGAAVAAAVGAYFAIVHLLKTARVIGGGRKEVLVGVLFAAGVSIPLAAGASDQIANWVPEVGAFAALCWMNCGLIALWEAEAGSSQSIYGPVVACVLAITLAVVGPGRVTAAVFAAVGLLLGFHLCRHRLGPRVLRVAADAALLTPLAWGWS